MRIILILSQAALSCVAFSSFAFGQLPAEIKETPNHEEISVVRSKKHHHKSRKKCCKQCPTGPTGPAGGGTTQGPTGPRGPTGPVGSSTQAVYGTLLGSATGPQPYQAGATTIVQFTQPGVLKGGVTAGNNNDLIVPVAGNYEISFSFSGITAVPTPSTLQLIFQIFQNASDATGLFSMYYTTNVTTPSTGEMINVSNGSTILPLNAGDHVTLRITNIDNASVTIGNGNFTQGVTLSVKLLP